MSPRANQLEDGGSKGRIRVQIFDKMTAPERYAFTVRATDAARRFTEQAFTLVVAALPPPVQAAGGYQIPPTEYNAAALRWSRLAAVPEGATELDFDGDGIPNEQSTA